MPFILVGLFGLFWLYYGYFFVDTIRNPSVTTVLGFSAFYLFFFLFFTIAYVLTVGRSSKTVGFSINKILNIERRLLWVYLLISPFVFFFFIQGLQYMALNGVEGYRDLTYGSRESPSVIFKNLQLELVYRLFVSPILFIGAFIGIAIFYMTGRYRLILLVVVLGLFDSVMMLGRFYFYHLVFLFMAGFFLKSTLKKIGFSTDGINGDRFKKKTGFPAVIVSLVLLVLISISLIRAGEGKGIPDLLDRYVFEYHTVGFTLFDDALGDQDSPINNNIMYGGASFSGLIRYPLVITKQFLNDIDRGMAVHSAYRSTFTDVGAEEGRRMYNSYYTILYTFYLDGRWFGVVFGAVLLGILSGVAYKKFTRVGDLKGMVACLLLLYVMYFSIFSSPIESEKFFGGIIFFLLVYHFRWSPPSKNKILRSC